MWVGSTTVIGKNQGLAQKEPKRTKASAGLVAEARAAGPASGRRGCPPGRVHGGTCAGSPTRGHREDLITASRVRSCAAASRCRAGPAATPGTTPRRPAARSASSATRRSSGASAACPPTRRSAGSRSGSRSWRPSTRKRSARATRGASRCVSRVLHVFTRGAARRAIAATRARTQDLEGAIADLERKLEVDAAAYTPEQRKSFIPSLGSIAVWKSTSASGAPDNWLRRAVRNRHRHAIEQASRRWRGGRRDDSARARRKILISTQVHRRDRFLRNAAAPAPAALGRDARRGERPRRRAAEPPVPGLGRRVTRAAPHRISKEATTEAP